MSPLAPRHWLRDSIKGITLGSDVLAGRWIGLSARDCALLGLLLNTRGLKELVILSVGLNAGIFSQLQYSIFVIVAVITTAISTPLCRLVLALRSTSVTG